MRRLKIFIALIVTAALLAAPACSRPSEPLELLIQLRDDAAHEDVDTLRKLIVQDAAVEECDYLSESANPSPEQVAATPTSTLRGDKPWMQARLLVTLSAGADDGDVEALTRSIEGSAVFESTVLCDEDGAWWQVQDQ